MRVRSGFVAALAAASLVAVACEGETPDAEEAEFEPVEQDPGADSEIDATDPEEPGEPGEDGTDGGAAQGDAFEGEGLSDATLTTTSSDLGAHVVDGEGRTVYVFADDPPNESTCTADCVSVWPIVSTDDEPSAEGLDEDLVGSFVRDDGSEQVTLDDQPLYYYVGDGEVGATGGQGLDDRWFVVSPEGEPVTG